MKQLLLISLIWIFALPVFALGGVGVGNGRTAYTSPVGLTVLYPSSLTLDIFTDGEFQISNAKLVPTAAQTSKIVFDVSHGLIKSIAELQMKITNEYPGKEFLSLTKPGATGFYWESRTDDELNGIYLLLTNNGDLVVIKISASSDGNGIALIEPIVNSLTYDVTPPLITEVRFANRVWTPGSHQKVILKMTDDLSGIKLNRIDIDWFVDKSGNVIEVMEPNSRSTLKSEGYDFYSFEFTVSKYARAGLVSIGSITVYDNANNSIQLYETDKHPGGYYQGPDRPQISVPTAKLVSKLPADTEAPKLIDIQVKDKEWKSGTSPEVFFKLSDNLSGISTSWVITDGLVHKVGSDLTRVKYPFPHFRAVGKGWYALKLDLSPYLPTGDYFLPGFTIFDKANNALTIGMASKDDHYYRTSSDSEAGTKVKIPIVSVHITNVGGEDVSPPQLLDWKPMTSLAAGTTQRFYFRATDNLSGFAKGGGHAFIYPVDQTKSDSGFSSYFQNPKSEGNDWYSIDLVLSPYLKPGDYYLGVFELEDGAGNIEEVNCIRKTVCTVGNQPTKFSRMIFKMTR